jgi:sarcosine oxidase subunit beta
MGFEHEVILNRAEVHRHLPAAAEHVVGGLASLRDGFAQPFWTTFAFRQKAEKLGVRFYEHCAVNSIFQEKGIWHAVTHEGTFKAPKLLNAAGAWAGKLAESLGENAPVEAIAPMMMVTSRMPHFCDAVVGATGRPLSFKQMPNGTVVIGGARRGRVNPDKNLSEILFPELRLSASTAQDLFPIMRDAQIVRTWSGVEGRMPDDLPVIGLSHQHEGLYHAFGFSAHGFQMGPGTGATMAELISTGSTQISLAPFSISRFVG